MTGREVIERRIQEVDGEDKKLNTLKYKVEMWKSEDERDSRTESVEGKKRGGRAGSGRPKKVGGGKKEGGKVGFEEGSITAWDNGFEELGRDDILF